MQMKRSTNRFLLAGLSLVFLAGCAITVPADPEGTLETVRDGTLRVGVSPNPPWTELHEGDDPSGVEPELARQFAATLDAEIE
jgi:membrane-bound lytic murein transglycosylase MltF